MVLGTAVEFDWDILQLDVQTAFLNANVEEEVYVKMAPGYEKDEMTGVPLVMRLHKSLYGLRQSPMNWHSTIDTYVTKIGFKPLKSDPYVYVYYMDDDYINNSTANTSRKPEAILTLYVDDLMLTGGDKAVLKMLKETLMNRVATADMGDISLILGMKITRIRENGTLTISQAIYTRSVLEKYGTGECKPVNTPGAGKELSLDQPEGNLLNATEKPRYQATTCSLMYPAQVTRDDILFNVNQLARAISKPSNAHMGAAKHVLRYHAGTINVDITYKKGGFTLTAFSDANWGNNPDTGKSMSSYIMMMSNGPVSFKEGLQGITAQSTLEAELVAAALAMKEAVFCANMMQELGFGEKFKCVPLHIDNT